MKSFKKPAISENSDGSIKSVTSFGKNFVAPGRKQVSHNTSFVVKSKNHDDNKAERLKQEQENLKNLLENNPIKKLLLEKRQKEQNKSEPAAGSDSHEQPQTVFSVGDRVFHSKFGVGKVTDIKQIGSSEMIIADFGAQGVKALDSAFAQLKKF